MKNLNLKFGILLSLFLFSTKVMALEVVAEAQVKAHYYQVTSLYERITDSEFCSFKLEITEFKTNELKPMSYEEASSALFIKKGSCALLGITEDKEVGTYLSKTAKSHIVIK